MTHYSMTGVDPGLVDTGIATITLDTAKQQVHVKYDVVSGADPHVIADAVRAISPPGAVGTIEQYRNRGTVFTEDKKMATLEYDLRVLLDDFKLMENMGVKKIITATMLRRLRLPQPPSTNHSDVLAAVRIGLFGAARRDHGFNHALFQALLAGKDSTTRWQVIS